jgi:hypothetical protein
MLSRNSGQNEPYYPKNEKKFENRDLIDPYFNWNNIKIMVEEIERLLGGFL